MPAIIIGGIAAAGAVAGGVIASQGAQSAAETQAEAQQAQINAQQAELDKKRQEQAKAVALKSQALDEFKLPGVLESQEGKDLATKLKARSEGIGVGYSPEVLNADTAATAKQTRASLKEQTIPAINAAASSRGLGRSSVAVSQVGSATQAAERDIESRIAQLQVASEAQKSADVQNALTGYGSMVESQTKTKQAEAGTRLTGEFSIADTEMGVANSNFQDASAINQLIANQGATQAAYQLQQAAILAGAITGATSAFGKGLSTGNEDIINAINAQQQTNNARVNIASPSGNITSQDVGLTSNYRLLPTGG